MIRLLRLACLLLGFASLSLAAQTIALISDLNGRYGSVKYSPRVESAVAAIIDMRPDGVFCTGDMVAGQKSPQLPENALVQMWSAFHTTVTKPLLAAKIPMAVTPGNHDGSAYPEFALERARYNQQWHTPPSGLEILPGSQWPQRYAARLGSVLLVAFDGTLPGKLRSSEREFVRGALEQHGPSASATIVMSHLPMWPLARGRESEIINDPELLALLHGHGVDIYASGHHHVFFAGTDDAGMIHLSVGPLGGNVRNFSGKSGKQPHSFSVIEFESGQIRITARAAPGFSDTVNTSGFPGSIAGPLGELQRLDGPVALRSR